MKTNNWLSIMLLIALLVCISCSSVKTSILFKNYISNDVTVNVESYTKKGSLKHNESVLIPKGFLDPEKKPASTDKEYTTIGYKGGNIKMKYYPTGGNSNFTLDPLVIPDSRRPINFVQTLTGLTMYDVNDGKQRLMQLGTDLKFDSTTVLYRMVDISPLIGSLVFGKMEGNKLVITDNYLIKEGRIQFDKPSTFEQNTITEKSLVSALKLSIPIYGSIEASMTSSSLYKITWLISYYSFNSNISTSTLLATLSPEKKKELVDALGILPKGLNVYIISSFDVIESGVFNITKGTEIITGGNVAVASVFTGNTAYTFRADDSQIISIPNKAYNIKFVEWETVDNLLKKLKPADTKSAGDFYMTNPIFIQPNNIEIKIKED